MAEITYPYIFVNMDEADGDEVNANFNAITAQFNGNIDTGQIANNAITAAKIAPGEVGNTELADNAVTLGKMADDSVGTAELIADSVGTSELAPDSVTSVEIANDAVGTTEIAADSVGTSELAPDSVTATEIAPGAVGTSELEATALAATNPPGVILPYAGASAPTGYLLCDGSAVSRTTYAALFAITASAYGAGDGSTTFNLPNLKGKVPVGRDSGQTEFDVVGESGGAKTHTLTTTEIPDHVHSLGSWVKVTGLGSTSAGSGHSDITGYSSGAQVSANDGGGNGAHNNLQPYQVVNYIIKT